MYKPSTIKTMMNFVLLILLIAQFCSCEQTDKLLCSSASQCDDNNPCTDDSCLLNLCFHSNTRAGTVCDDGLFCTSSDQCNGAGLCLGTSTTCSGQCNSHCNETTKSCFSPINTSCDDGLWCNGQDFCNGAGNCTLHSGNPCANISGDCKTTNCSETSHCRKQQGSLCTDDNNSCTSDMCDNQGNCMHAAKNGTSCDDGVYCTVNDTCVGSVCNGGPWNPLCSCQTATDCDDNTICTIDSCSNGTCSHVPNNGISCSDGNWCNGEEICGGGVCQAGTPPCSSSTPCNSTCNNATKTCHAPINTQCDDNVFCNGNDFCDGQGSCVPSNVSPCGGVCKGYCNETQRVCADPQGTDCDDGLFCNGHDSCDGSGHCVPSLVDPCLGFPQCQDSCGEDLHACVNATETQCQGDFCGGAIYMCMNGQCTSVAPRCNESFPICDAQNEQCIANTTETNSTSTTTSDGTTSSSTTLTEPNPSSSPLVTDDGSKKKAQSNFLVIGASSGGGVLIVGAICAGICVAKRKKKKNSKRDSLSMEERSTNRSTGFYADASGGSSSHDNVWNGQVSNIIILDHVGSGTFGDVYKGLMQKDKNSPMIEVALKALKQEDSFSDFIDEAAMLSHLDHPNVVKFYGMFVQNHKYIVTEFMNRGSLLDLLHCTSFPQYPCKEIALGAAKGMAYLHSKSVIHRDLACRNLLVNFDHGNYIVKISDFGMARAIERYYYSNSTMIPIRWSAPEALAFKKYSSPSDVWSFGIVLWEIYSRGAEPYAGSSNADVVQLVLNGYRLEKPEECPDDMFDIMQLCWQHNKNERPTFDDLVQLISKANIYKVTPTQKKEDPVLANFVTEARREIDEIGQGVTVFEDDESLPPSYGANNHA